MTRGLGDAAAADQLIENEDDLKSINSASGSASSEAGSDNDKPDDPGGVIRRCNVAFSGAALATMQVDTA
jgi:hypothetical protein